MPRHEPANGECSGGPRGGELTKTADRTYGPRPEGGEIVAAGPPEEIVREKRSYTGAFLKPVLARRGGERGKKKRVEAAE